MITKWPFQHLLYSVIIKQWRNMISMEDRARELINPLDLGCEALRDKIVKIFIQALKDQEEITKNTALVKIDKIIALPDDVCDEFERGYRASAKVIKGHIINVNTEKGTE